MYIDIIVLSFIIAAAIIGNKFSMLTKSGAIASVIVGLSIYLAFGIEGLSILGAFFLTSSFWSKFRKDKKLLAEEKNEKSGQRDILQVMANGGSATVSAILFMLFPSTFWFGFFVTSIAAANSDTWASEIGVLSKSKPIHIIKLEKTDPGTSGALSPLGTYASFLGSLLISALAVMLFSIPYKFIIIFALIGFIGSMLDTVFGAIIQRSYVCSVCQLETEKTVHCKEKTKIKKGSHWVNNDVVNFSATTGAAIIGGTLFFLYG
jgi:uncharacterized protein (TIGR00297 family)